MFGVYDNNKPCSVIGFPYLSLACWKTHQFETFEQALAYLEKWLGNYSGCIPHDYNGCQLDYSGYGDIVEIRTE